MTLDMRGKICPIPVVETKKAIKAGNSQVTVLVDNIEATQNLEKYANGSGLSYAKEDIDDYFAVTVASVSGSGQNTASEPVKSGLVVVVSGDTMGRGAEELGRILLKSFIYSLTVQEPLPECVIFYNSGVLLPASDNPDLKTLEEKGVEILACGACSNFYNVADKLQTGRITDMYAITERMAKAERLINI